jgi:hypothetical protein
MADFKDLTGDYEKDWPKIRDMFLSLTNEADVDNRVGQVIEHTFTTTSAEEISHDLNKTPTLWEILDTTVAGTVYRDSWSSTSISLVSSNSSQVVKIYVE